MYEEGDATVSWNQTIHTDREVTADRPDIIIKNRKEKTCTLIDVAIPADRNVVTVHDQTAHRQVHWIQIKIEGIQPHTNTDI
jgi:hypothetical protein